MRQRLCVVAAVVGAAAALVAVLLEGNPLLPLSSFAAALGVCPPVQNTPFFTIVYGPVTVDGQPAPEETVVEARSPRGDAVGCFVVTDPGNYGAMYVYGEDTSVTPAIPGMRSGETVAFYVDGVEAVSSPTLVWANDKDLHHVELSATLTSPPPIADFTVSPTSGIAPLPVQFTDLSSGEVDTWLWSFGDSGTSASQHPTHTYTAKGVYTVTLVVSGPGGSDDEVKGSYITVYEPVAADFGATPTKGFCPLVVTFTNQSTGDYTASQWSFGDGVTSTLPSPTHTYAITGTFAVSLAVSGPGGTDAEAKTGYITVWERHSVYLPLVLSNY